MAKERQKVINTKISPSDYMKFERLAEIFGMSIYELLQGIIFSLLRYCDKESQLSEEHCKLIEAFFDPNFFKSDGGFSTLCARDTMSLQASSAVVFLSRTKAGRIRKDMRPQAILLSKQGEELQESYNYNDMLRLLLTAADPDTLKVLERLQQQDNDFSLFQTLNKMAKANLLSSEEAISKDVEELFSDIRLGTGEKINEGCYYKRKNNKAALTSQTEVRRTIRADIA